MSSQAASKDVTMSQQQRVNHIHNSPETFIGIISISHDAARAQMTHPKSEAASKTNQDKHRKASVTSTIRASMQAESLKERSFSITQFRFMMRECLQMHPYIMLIEKQILKELRYEEEKKMKKKEQMY